MMINGRKSLRAPLDYSEFEARGGGVAWLQGLMVG